MSPVRFRAAPKRVRFGKPTRSGWLGEGEMHFVSDNQSGLHPAVLTALAEASTGNAAGYGEDPLTTAAETAVEQLFETPCSVFFVTTGTAANALALSALCPPWGAIYCHLGSHVQNDENTAVELYTGGARLVGIPGKEGKPALEQMQAHIQTAAIHGVHNARPGAISLSNVTESGTVYGPAELASYRALADEHDLYLHVDGARFANAVVSTGATPAELTWRAGVDCLSFGLTKNGGMATEAVVIFNQSVGEQFEYRRKRAGHLWSKHRFLAAQWLALLDGDIWLKNAEHANDMAQKLANGFLQRADVNVPWPVQANEIFPVIPAELRSALREAGMQFYDWPAEADMTRFVTSFATEATDVEAALAIISSA